MRTISLKLPERLARRLAVAARKFRSTKSAIVREAIEAYLATGDGARGISCADLAGDLLGSVDSGIGDLSTNKKHLVGFGR